MKLSPFEQWLVNFIKGQPFLRQILLLFAANLGAAFAWQTENYWLYAGLMIPATVGYIWLCNATEKFLKAGVYPKNACLWIMLLIVTATAFLASSFLNLNAALWEIGLCAVIALWALNILRHRISNLNKAYLAYERERSARNSRFWGSWDGSIEV